MQLTYVFHSRSIKGYALYFCEYDDKRKLKNVILDNESNLLTSSTFFEVDFKRRKCEKEIHVYHLGEYTENGTSRGELWHTIRAKKGGKSRKWARVKLQS